MQGYLLKMRTVKDSPLKVRQAFERAYKNTEKKPYCGTYLWKLPYVKYLKKNLNKFQQTSASCFEGTTKKKSIILKLLHETVFLWSNLMVGSVCITKKEETEEMLKK